MVSSRHRPIELARVTSLEEFIDNFIPSRCISLVRPLSLIPTEYSFLFMLSHGVYAYHPVIVLAIIPTHICTLHFLYRAFICPVGTVPSQVSSPISFLGCYLIVTRLMSSRPTRYTSPERLQ